MAPAQRLAHWHDTAPAKVKAKVKARKAHPAFEQAPDPNKPSAARGCARIESAVVPDEA